MKKYLFVILLMLGMSAVFDQPTSAQSKRLNSSPQSFQIFFAKFLNAVKKKDKVRVASMTNFPFRFGFDAGDEGIMSRKQFIERFAEIFGQSPKTFLSEKNPLFSIGEKKSYVISTADASHLIFTRKDRIFKFSAYIVEP